MLVQFFNMLICNCKTCRLCMATITYKQVSTSTECKNDIESSRATGRATTLFWSLTQNKHGAVKLINQATCDEANNPFRPVVATDQQHLVVRVVLKLLVHLTHKCFCLLLAGQVEGF